MEQWKQIPAYPNYECSDTGKIRNKTSGKISYGTIANRGYIAVSISINGKRKIIHPHRIVAELFVENKDNKPYVNHIDGNKTNNDYNNLEWCTPLENTRHSLYVLKKSNTEKLKKKVLCIETNTIYESCLSTAKEMNVNSGFISQCCNGKKTNVKGLHFVYI